ncbi:MAG: type IV secretory system conjugative DNA transfer family protein [Bilifractor sp.]
MYYTFQANNDAQIINGWPQSENRSADTAAVTGNGCSVAIPVLSDNVLAVGTTRNGKTTFVQETVQQRLMAHPDSSAVFFDSKDDFRNFRRKQDKVVTMRPEHYPDKMPFFWNILREVRFAQNPEAVTRQIADMFFRELKDTSTNNRFFITGAENLFHAFLLRAAKDPAMQNNQDFLKKFYETDLSHFFHYLADLPGNRPMLRNIFQYNGQEKSGGISRLPPAARDMLAIMQEVLAAAETTSLKGCGDDTIVDFINGRYESSNGSGSRLFLDFDFEKRASLSGFFAFLLEKLISAKLSKDAGSREGHLLLVLDEIQNLQKDFGLLTAATLGNGLGLQVILSVQSIEQLYAIAPELNREHTAKGAFAGFSELAIFHPGDETTWKFAQTICGKKRTMILTMPFSRYDHPTTQTELVPCISDQDLSGLEPCWFYLKIRGSEPVKLKLIKR